MFKLPSDIFSGRAPYAWAFALLATLSAFLLQEPSATAAGNPASTWSGEVVRILDGDTVEILHDSRTARIRLANIDAPEKGQAFGARSRDYLGELVFRRVVQVESLSRDQYGRTIAVLYVSGKNVNAEMVGAGLAWVYTRYNTDPSLPALEQQARDNRVGLWRDGSPVPPWSYRHANSR